ncbi:protein translocase subunit SecF [Granulicoccus sp. GXG6511]|uniref:protein translocase subunit SecF n=1 Tax=Granulicoccus sp. GXG6511 TaxID=3381351 RepID=UPI003D7C74BC
MSDTELNESTSAPNKAASGRKSIANRLYTGDISLNIVGLRKRWYVMSGIIIAIALAALVFRGLALGIEFSGGADFQAPTRVTTQTVDEMRAAVQGSGLPDLGDTTVTTMGDNTVRIQTRTLDPQTEVPVMREVIAEQVGVDPDQVAYSLIGASWGKQITQQGLIALGVFLVLVMLLIWVYFRDLKMSIAAIVALLHDLVLTIGIYALIGFTFTPATLIGMLTILGYSLYDTVVVFDKVRENVRGLHDQRRSTYAALANKAVNQVLIRSINTTIIGVLPVAALLVAGWLYLGTGPLKDLGLVLFVGMIAGAYSSVLIATPLLVDMKMREPEIREHTEAVERGTSGVATRRSGRREPVEVPTDPVEDSVVEPADDDASDDLETEPAAPRITTSTAQQWPTIPADRQQPRRQTRSERKK